MHTRPDNIILRGKRVFLKTGKAEIDVTQVYNLALEAERQRMKDKFQKLKIIPMSDKPDLKSEISDDQIFMSGQVNLMMRLNDLFNQYAHNQNRR